MNKINFNKNKSLLVFNINLLIVSFCSLLYMDDKSRLIVTIPCLLLIVGMLIYIIKTHRLNDFLSKTFVIFKNKIFIMILLLNLISLMVNFSMFFAVVIISNLVTIFWALISAYFYVDTKLDFKYSYIGLKYSHLLFLVYSFFIAHQGRTKFFGIYKNYNTNAIVTSFFSVMVLIEIFFAFKSKKVFIAIYNALLFIFGLYLTMLTHSRAALGIVFFSVIILVIIGIYHTIQNKVKIKTKNLILYCFLVALILVILINVPQIKSLTASVLDKISQKGSIGAILDGRDKIWLQIFRDMSLFGNGIFYFINNKFQHIPKFAPHNGLFSILGIYGLVLSIVLFYYFIINVPIKIITQRKELGENLTVVFILVFQFFIMYSIPESMSYRPVMFLIYILIFSIEYKLLEKEEVKDVQK